MKRFRMSFDYLQEEIEIPLVFYLKKSVTFDKLSELEKTLTKKYFD